MEKQIVGKKSETTNLKNHLLRSLMYISKSKNYEINLNIINITYKIKQYNLFILFTHADHIWTPS